MSDRHRFRTMIVAVSGGALLVLGSGAAAADSNYPMGGGGPDRAAQEPGKQAERAEKFGGGLSTKLVDLGGSVLKCGLSVAVSTVKCDM
ncbi:hypothetical protein [Nocardia sp. NPDC051570]|uniref:hypothetical protein n=1 Tax=Nocardia sp. NPDC051570 TaxID=3364324 RepID=UPI0037B51F34